SISPSTPATISTSLSSPRVALSSLFLFFFQRSGDPRDLHSFPTRRSSDLTPAAHRSHRRTAALLPFEPHEAFGNQLPVHADFRRDRKSTRLNSSHVKISYAVFCLKKKKKEQKVKHEE